MKDGLSRKVDRVYRAKSELDWAAKLYEFSKSEMRETIDRLDSVNLIDADSATMLRQGGDTDYQSLIDGSWEDLRAMESAILIQLEQITRSARADRRGESKAEHGTLTPWNLSFLLATVRSWMQFEQPTANFLRTTGGFEVILSTCVEVHRRLLQLSDAYGHASPFAFDFYSCTRDQLQDCLGVLENDDRAGGRFIGDLRLLGKKLDAELEARRQKDDQPPADCSVVNQDRADASRQSIQNDAPYQLSAVESA